MKTISVKLLLNSEVCYLFTQSDNFFFRLEKLAFSDPDYIGKSLKLKTDTLSDGSSAHLLSVKLKIFYRILKIKIVEIVHRKQAFYRVKSINLFSAIFKTNFHEKLEKLV